MPLIAIYHCSIKIISRGKGKSAVAAAAYRAGETITNEYDRITHDYTRKGGIVHTEIILPDHAPSEYADRAVLWNAVEKVERYKTAQLAREIEIALPAELTQEQNISLVRRFVKEQFVNAGMCADVCIHDKGDGNPHTHIMLTIRPIDNDGKWGQKSHTVDGRKIPTVDWNEHDRVEDWRRAWAAYCNTTLRINGHADVVDHRSYERQGIEQIPTVHLGAAASQMEKRGIITDRGNINREIGITNREIRRLRARITELDKWLTEESVNLEPPTLTDVISEILNRQGQSGLTRLKAAAEMLVFLKENKIYDAAGLEEKVKSIGRKFQSVRTNLKKVERRIDTLKEHLCHSDNFKNHRKVNARYESLHTLYKTAKKATGFGAERKARKALSDANDYYELHRSELTMFNNAEQYLRDVLQERFDQKKLPPITKWTEELTAKTAKREAMYREYQTLRDETTKLEQIRRSVTEILHSDTPGFITPRSRGLGR